MSGLPISALAYGRSARRTWLLLTGTSSSPALTSDATLTCAFAGCATANTAAAAARSAPCFKALSAISPHLHLIALDPSIHLDRVASLGRRSRLHDRVACRTRGGVARDHRGAALRRAGNGATKAANDGRCRQTRATVDVVAKVIHADRLDNRIVLLAGLAQDQAKTPDLLRERELLRVERVDLERRGMRQLGRAVGILRLLIDRYDADILQQDVGHLRVGTRWVARNQH